MPLKRLVCVVLLLPNAVAYAIDVDNPPKGVFADDWYAIMLDGQKSGHMHSTMQRQGDVIRSQTKMVMTAGRGATNITVTMTQESEETLAGEPLSFANTMELGRVPTKTQGTIRDGKVSITTSQFGMMGSKSIYTLPEGAKMSWGVYREQLKHGLAPGTRYELAMYEPTMAADRLTPMTVEVLEREKVDLFGRLVEATKTRQTMKVKALLGQEMAVETITWMKEDGSPVKLQMSLINIPVELISCSKTVATAKDDPADLMSRTLVRVNPAPSPEASRVRYRITFRSTGRAELPKLPETGMQKVEKQSGNEAVLVVTRGGRGGEPGTALSEADREIYLKASPMLNYKDPEVARLVKEAAGDEKDPWKLADRFRRFVGDYIDSKTLSVGFASASEVARSKEGDCTEHGLLLAAMGRAMGIPTRIVTGIVYSDRFGPHRDVFVGHLWTQYYLDGRWVDLDAALHETEVEPTHIALDVNAVSDNAIADLVSGLWLTMGNMEIKVLEGAAATRPAAELE